ncbi:MAG: GAF domain-containing protein [Phycisphaerae bacterium]
MNTWIVPSILGALVSTVVLVCVYGYLWSVMRRKYMAIWALAWVLYVFRLVFQLKFVVLGSGWLNLASLLLGMSSGFVLLLGTMAFLDRHLGRRWFAATVLAAGLLLGLHLAPDFLPARSAFLWQSLPAFAFLGVVNIYMGAAILYRSRFGGLGRRMTGWTLIVWGLHKLDYPILRPIKSLAWAGYLGGAVLGLMTAVGMLLLAFDRSRRELASSENRFEGLFESAADGIFLVNSEHRILRANDQAGRMLQVPRNELIGQFLSQFLTDMTREKLTALSEKISTRGPETIESTFLARGSLPLPVELRIAASRQEASADMVVIARDIRLRKKSQMHLRRELATNAAVAQLAGALLSNSNPIQQIAQVVKDSAERLTASEYGFVSAIDPKTGDNVGHTLDAMMGSACRVDPDKQAVRFAREADGYPGLWGHALNQREGFFTNQPDEHPASKGVPAGHMPIRNYLAAPAIAGGQLVGLIALANTPEGYSRRDLESVQRLADLYALALQRQQEFEHRQQLEQQLRHSQKMEAVGQLAGGVAHDFNNLLQVICGYCSVLLEQADPDDPDTGILQEIHQAGQRATELTRQLLTFSRRQATHPQPLDVNEVIESLAKMLCRLIGEQIQLKIDCEGKLGPVLADRGQIEQVVINLCLNARDAMPDGGSLQIRTAQVRLDAAQADIAGLKAGDYALLRVIDTGTGIDPKIGERVFEPFFSTKEVGQGTGLGLATAYATVDHIDGTIRFESQPGVGTSFEVYLPLSEADQQAAPPESPSTRESPIGGKETILLAEDDPMVRRLAVRVLQAAGYHLIVCNDGEEAIRQADQQGQIDLALLDMVMPRRSGREVADHLRSRRIDMPILFCSGYSSEPSWSQIPGEEIPLLAKPYNPRQLLAAVRQALSSSGAADPAE